MPPQAQNGSLPNKTVARIVPFVLSHSPRVRLPSRSPKPELKAAEDSRTPGRSRTFPCRTHFRQVPGVRLSSAALDLKPYRTTGSYGRTHSPLDTRTLLRHNPIP